MIPGTASVRSATRAPVSAPCADSVDSTDFTADDSTGDSTGDAAGDIRPLGLAPFFPAVRRAEPLFRDWMVGHRDVLFGWAMARAQDAAARRGLAESAVAIQRLRGSSEFLAWLYGTAVQLAHAEATRGGLAEPALAGLAPELRTVLRLVSRGGLRPEEATALQAQRLGFVRCRLLQTRLQR